MEPSAVLTGWTVKNCTINSAGGYGLRLRNITNNTFKDNTFTGAGAQHIWLESNADNNLITGNDLLGGWAGVWNNGDTSSTGNTISDNLVNTSWGIAVDPDNKITENDITASPGILAYGSGVLDITDNTFHGTSGVVLQDGVAGAITGNVMGNTFINSDYAMWDWGATDSGRSINFSYNTVSGTTPNINVPGAPNAYGTGSNTNIISHNTVRGNSTVHGGASVGDNLFVGSVTLNTPAYFGTLIVYTNYTAANDAAVAFMSTTPTDADYLYLSCDTPDAILTGATGGTYFGALPIGEVCCISGNEELLAACKAGRDLVKATTGWNQLRNYGEGKGQGVLLNMPLIAHTASTYVDSLEICNEADADELHSCIVSYFASGGKSSHFGE